MIQNRELETSHINSEEQSVWKEDKKGNGQKSEFSPTSEKELLIRWVVDAFFRTIVHYGYWLKEVEYHYGMGAALEIEKEVGETSFTTQLNPFRGGA